MAEKSEQNKNTLTIPDLQPILGERAPSSPLMLHALRRNKHYKKPHWKLIFYSTSLETDCHFHINIFLSIKYKLQVRKISKRWPARQRDANTDRIENFSCAWFGRQGRAAKTKVPSHRPCNISKVTATLHVPHPTFWFGKYHLKHPLARHWSSQQSSSRGAHTIPWEKEWAVWGVPALLTAILNSNTFLNTDWSFTWCSFQNSKLGFIPAILNQIKNLFFIFFFFSTTKFKAAC